MNHGDILRERAVAWRRFARILLACAVVGLVAAWIYRVPSPDRNTAFAMVEVDWHMDDWWRTHAAPLADPAPAIGRMLLAIVALGACAGKAIRQLCRGRFVGAAAFALMALLAQQAMQIGLDRGGFSAFEPARLSNAAAHALDQAADDPAQRPRLMREANDANLLLTGNGKGRLPDPQDFTPSSAGSIIHFVLAQRAYLLNDPAETRRQLLGVTPSEITHLSLLVYRYNVMREWVAARGYAAPGLKPVSVWRGKKLTCLPILARRVLSWTALVLAVSAIAAAILLFVLSVTMARRAGRLDDLAGMMGIRA